VRNLGSCVARRATGSWEWWTQCKRFPFFDEVGWDEGVFDGVGVDSCNSNSIEFDGIRIGIAEVDGRSFARFFSTAVAGVVNVVFVMAELRIVEIPRGIAHRRGGVGQCCQIKTFLTADGRDKHR